jgi:acyl-CoA thioester hydrolase
MTPFHITRRVEFHETDMAGIAHFSNFFRWMECAEIDFLRARGLSVMMTWENEPIAFPRVSATCDYVKTVRFDELLDIAVTIARLGEKSVTYAFEFSRDGDVLARGKLTSACCRVGSDQRLQAMLIPAGYRQRLEAIVAPTLL